MAEQSPVPLPLDAPPTSVVHFNATVLFYLCLAASVLLVLLFCIKKFDERSNTASDDYVYQLMPSQLATAQEYRRGFFIYFFGLAGVVIFLSLLGTKNLVALGLPIPQAVGDVILPLALAFFITGIMPNVPVLQGVEKWGRQYAHEIAYIPRSALATAERLSTAGFDFSAYSGEAMYSEEMRGVDPEDFKKSRRSVEYAWARLGCLVYVENSYLLQGSGETLDTSLLQAYKKDLELIQANKKAMEAEVAAYRAEKLKNPNYANEALNRAIRNNLYKLYILLGCAVRIKKQPHNDVNLPLQQLGFQLGKSEAERNNNDIILVGITACAAVVLVGYSIAVAVGDFNWWNTSPVFPSSYYTMFTEGPWVLIPYGAAILVGDLMRKRAIRNGWWFAGSGQNKRRNPANYIRIAVVCGIVGYVGLLFWDLLFLAPTIQGLKLEVPYALLAIATGAFHVWHLDNVELNARPSMRWEFGTQALVTGVCGLIAAAASWNILFDDTSFVVDRIVLTGLISAAIGAVLAWYIPAAATAAKVDPLAEAMEERVQKLEAAAAARFNDPAAASRWLDQPHPALEQKSPRQAARDLDGYEHAMSLLQGPQAIAA